MNNSITDFLNGKRILIFGYGREGRSTEQYIRSHCDVMSLDVFEGKREEIDEDKYDVIIKSPGIVMLEDNPKYTSQTELFLNEFFYNTVGVTGTKGKSTTSAMLAHTLNGGGKKALLLGNIGKPCFDMIDEIDSDTIIVFELSCHQLLHIDKAPHISVFLNLYEEHLDYYGTIDKYFSAKANIISHQAAGDFALLGSNVPYIKSESLQTVILKPHTDYDLFIRGSHNKLNAEFVFYIAHELLKLDEKTVISGIQDFRGLPHRLEYFGTYDGISCYDDSISTIPKACIQAVESIDGAKTVIAGGMDRGIEYGGLAEYIRKRKDVYFILCYATGERIIKMLDNEKTCDTADEDINYTFASDLDSAVLLAKKVTCKGGSVILSPAAPSYGYFKDFEERGEYFKKLCRGEES